MATIRENARHGAALLMLATGGCLSTEDSLFHGVAAPDPRPLDTDAPALALEPGAAPARAPAGATLAPESPSSTDLPLTGEGPGGDGSPAMGEASSAAPSSALEMLEDDVCTAPEDLIACDTFEAAEVGVFPSGPGWLAELPGCGSHRVDGAGPSFSGTRSLRASDAAYPECMLHADVSGESDVYVRTRVWLGAGSGALERYTTLLEFGVRAEQDDPELRIGARPEGDNVCPGVPGLDVTGSGLDGGPATECTGALLEEERWYCLEAHLERDGRRSRLSVGLDGEPLVVRSFAGSAAWSGTELYVKLGRAAYGPSGEGSVWHDDIVVSREPLPCVP